MTFSRRNLLCAAIATGALALSAGAHAQKKYDTGASDTEIKLGHIVPYSGPASAYGTVGKAMAGYYQMINDQGGVNGRKIKLLSMDDAYNPAKTVEVARQLVEHEGVLALVSPLGSSQNAAIVKYMNIKKVPHIFLSTGATRWGDYQNFPWTMGWQPTYQAEGQIYAQHILKNTPNAKIAIVYQNDDFGKDYLKGFLDGLGDKAKTMVIKQITFQVADPTIDSQIIEAKGSGADVLFEITTPKFAAMAIKKVAELGWKPVHYLSSVSQSIAGVLKPAGFDNATGIISVTYLRDPLDPRWKDAKEVQEYLAWMKKYYPEGDPADQLNVNGYSLAQTMIEVIRKAGDNLTHENIIKQAANLDIVLPMVYPGIPLKTSPTDYYPLERMQPVKFNGKTWEPLGPVLGK